MRLPPIGKFRQERKKKMYAYVLTFIFYIILQIPLYRYLSYLKLAYNTVKIISILNSKEPKHILILNVIFSCKSRQERARVLVLQSTTTRRARWPALREMTTTTHSRSLPSPPEPDLSRQLVRTTRFLYILRVTGQHRQAICYDR